MSSRSYCFTAWTVPVYNPHSHRYMIYGIEECPKTKKIHYQGYAELFKNLTLIQFKQSIGDDTAHCEKRSKDSTREAAKHYCTKDGNFTEFGCWEAGGQGTRSDLRKIIQQITDNKTDHDLLIEDPDSHEKHYRWIQTIRPIIEEKASMNALEERIKDIKLNDFQNLCMKHLDNQGRRKVTWVSDKKGGIGKSVLTDILINKGFQYFCNSKSADIACALNTKSMGFVFDLSRSMESYVNYDIIEQLKNGRVFSSKYRSKMKVFAIPKVIIFANFNPDYTKLTFDRWDMIIIPSGNTNADGILNIF